MRKTSLVTVALEALRLFGLYGESKRVAYRTEIWTAPASSQAFEFCIDPLRRMAILLWVEDTTVFVAVAYTRDAVGGWIQVSMPIPHATESFDLSLDEFSARFLTPSVCALAAQIP